MSKYSCSPRTKWPDGLGRGKTCLFEGKVIEYNKTPDEELAEIAASEAAIQEAMEVEDVFTKDEVAKRSYEKAEKFRRDQAAQIRYATEEGRQEGREEGRKEGRKEGREEGILATIAALRSLNFDKRTIALKLVEVFGLDDKAATGYVDANW